MYIYIYILIWGPCEGHGLILAAWMYFFTMCARNTLGLTNTQLCAYAHLCNIAVVVFICYREAVLSHSWKAHRNQWPSTLTCTEDIPLLSYPIPFNFLICTLSFTAFLSSYMNLLAFLQKKKKKTWARHFISLCTVLTCFVKTCWT